MDSCTVVGNEALSPRCAGTRDLGPGVAREIFSKLALTGFFL